MRRSVIALVLFALIGGQAAFPLGATVAAQTVIERCVTQVGEPPADWTFGGTIVTFRPGDGLHGFRADTPSRYYIAFDNDTEYSGPGAFSPDGQWFASYLGRTEYTTSPMFNRSYFVTAIRVVSTHPSRETYVMPFESYYYGQLPTFPPLIWSGNEEFAARWGRYVGTHWIVANPFEGTIRDVTEEEADGLKEIGASIRRMPSYPSAGEGNDSPRAFLATGTQTSNRTLHVADPVTQQVYDTCIETFYGAIASPIGDQVAVGIGRDDGFVYVLDLNAWAAYRLDLAANYVIAWIADPQAA